uniref:Secreted protein n=1 Tax=Anopheles farauti TaxID=69004 RepID=A0A182Q3C5_9DIPT
MNNDGPRRAREFRMLVLLLLLLPLLRQMWESLSYPVSRALMSGTDWDLGRDEHTHPRSREGPLARKDEQKAHKSRSKPVITGGFRTCAAVCSVGEEGGGSHKRFHYSSDGCYNRGTD